MKKKTLKTNKGFPAVHGQTVERLTQGLRPAKAPMPLWGQWLFWTIGISALVTIFLNRTLLRDDLEDNLGRLSYISMVILIFVGAALAAWGALEASIPAGESKGKGKARLAFLLYGLAFMLFILFLPWNMENYPHHPLYLSCFVMSLFVGLAGWVGLGLLIRHNAPLNPGRVGVWAGVSAFMVGLGVVTLHCGSHNLAHVCLEHFLPVLAYSWLTGWLGYRWISSWKRKPLSK